MGDAHKDATTCTSPKTTSTPTTRRSRATTGAALSFGVAAAALAAMAAPVLESSTGSGSVAASEQTVAQAPIISAEARSAALDRASRSARGPLDAAEKLEAAREKAEAEAKEEAKRLEVVGTRYAADDVNVRTKPDLDAKVVAVLDPGAKVKITDVTEDGWRQVIYKDEPRWVKSSFLSKDKPKPKPSGPSSSACASGSGVENGLAATTIRVHRAVCNAFPSVSTYGGLRGGGGNHGRGHALDIMVSGSTGDAIAAYVRSHAKELGVSEVIWSQRIWTVQRASEGWRSMSDRGSATANHYDHVHVSTY